MEMQMKTAVRCDGNRTIATGHIMRCLSIADSLADMGGTVSFFVSDSESAELLSARMPQGRDFQVRILGSDHRDPAGELGAFSEILGAEGTAVLLADSYFIDAGYLREIKRLCPGLGTAYIDDFGAAVTGADLVINYAAADAGIYKRTGDNGETVLYGTGYAPLRRQFRGARMPVRSTARRVLVSSGGADAYDITEDIRAAVLDALPEAEIVIPRGVQDMAGLMETCDLAVSAGGTTVFELCAVGVPTITYVVADNQQPLTERMAPVLPCAGDIRTEEGRRTVLERIAEWVRRMAGDIEGRRSCSEKMRDISDARGAERIAEGLMELAKGK